MRPESPRPVLPPGRRALAVLLAAAVLACGGESDRGPEGRRVAQPGGASPSPVTPARYLTEMAFVPFDRAAGPAAYLRLGQDVTSERLALDYRGWSGGSGGWGDLLSAVDTVPVPRAGWRVVPSGPLRVVAGEGGRLRALTVRNGAKTLRIEPDSTLASWTGPTGQRERLMLGRRLGPEAAAAGLVVERRRARPREAPLPGRPTGFLLLTTPEEDGLLVLLRSSNDPGATSPDSATAAYGRLDGTLGAWNRVRLVPTASSEDGGARAWRLTVPTVQLQGELREVAARRAPSPADGGAATAGDGAGGGDGPSGAAADTARAGSTGPSLAWFRGTLRLAGRGVPVAGVLVETGTP